MHACLLRVGKPSDLWYSSCVDLFNSRFGSADLEALGARGASVLNVTRVHNRWLRARFDKRLSHMVDTSDPNYKRSLEVRQQAVVMGGGAQGVV